MMAANKSDQMVSRMQQLVQIPAKLVFARLPSQVRPFFFAISLFVGASALMYVGNSALLRLGFPWPLIYLLVVIVAANLWGVKPALLVLILSALYGALVVPYLHPLPTLPTFQPVHVIILRTFSFLACGGATIWLTYRAHLMQNGAEIRRGVVSALQTTLLPLTLAEAAGYDLCGVHKPLHHEEEVGGDFYDFYPIEEGCYGLIIGDVMGNGKEAAATTAFLRYSVRAFTSTGAHPAQIMGQLNRLIETQGLHFETATLFLGCLDINTGSLTYVNAGHEPPLLKRAGGEEETLNATGPILGIGLEVTYDQETTVLGYGDALLLMTDGVTEARNAKGEFLDSEGAWQLLRAVTNAPSSQRALSEMNSALMRYSGYQLSDDVAMLLLRRIQGEADDLRNLRSEDIVTREGDLTLQRR